MRYTWRSCLHGFWIVSWLLNDESFRLDDKPYIATRWLDVLRPENRFAVSGWTLLITFMFRSLAASLSDASLQIGVLWQCMYPWIDCTNVRPKTREKWTASTSLLPIPCLRQTRLIPTITGISANKNLAEGGSKACPEHVIVSRNPGFPKLHLLLLPRKSANKVEFLTGELERQVV